MNKKKLIIFSLILLFILTPIKDKIYNSLIFNWPNSKFSLEFYSSNLDLYPLESRKVSIDEDGTFISGIYLEKRLDKEYKGKLTDDKMKELFRYIIVDNNFFSIRQNKNTKLTHSGLEIKFNGLSKSIYGFLGKSDIYSKTLVKLLEIEKTFPVKDYSKLIKPEIENILLQAKNDFDDKREISLSLYAGLINKGYIPIDSKLTMTNDQLYKKLLLIAVGNEKEVHPTLVPTKEEINIILSTGYLSIENNFLVRLVEEDKINGVIPEWYTSNQVAEKWETEKYKDLFINNY